uniref:Putative antimicrobial peptide isamp n=1 Tax=Ixodes ricinus TaxID=34613 RepID=V5IHU0_IXORI
MRPLTIFIVTLLLLGSFHYVEPAKPHHVKTERPQCEVPCKQPHTCPQPCTWCNNGPWGDLLCKIKSG